MTRILALLALAPLVTGCAEMQYRLNENAFPPEPIYDVTQQKGAEAPLPILGVEPVGA